MNQHTSQYLLVAVAALCSSLAAQAVIITEFTPPDDWRHGVSISFAEATSKDIVGAQEHDAEKPWEYLAGGVNPPDFIQVNTAFWDSGPVVDSPTAQLSFLFYYYTGEVRFAEALLGAGRWLDPRLAGWFELRP